MGDGWMLSQMIEADDQRARPNQFRQIGNIRLGTIDDDGSGRKLTNFPGDLDNIAVRPNGFKGGNPINATALERTGQADRLDARKEVRRPAPSLQGRGQGPATRQPRPTRLRGAIDPKEDRLSIHFLVP